MVDGAHTIASWIVRFTIALYAGASSVPSGIPSLFSTSERTSRGVSELSTHLWSGSPMVTSLMKDTPKGVVFSSFQNNGRDKVGYLFRIWFSRQGLALDADTGHGDNQ
jgi:hypothetical protein